MTENLLIDDIRFTVVRKKVKNVRISVHAPDGRVQVSAPLWCSDSALYPLLNQRLAWVRQQQQRLLQQPVLPLPRFISGEIHQVWGQPYVLDVIESSAKAQVRINTDQQLQLFIRQNTPTVQRQQLLDEWYRQQLKQRIPELLQQRQLQMQVVANDWGVKKMKTRWGSCNIVAKRIWLNLELAKKPPQCLDYVLVHELTHLYERYHNKRFWQLMDHFMPDWRLHRQILNQSALL